MALRIIVLYRLLFLSTNTPIWMLVSICNVFNSSKRESCSWIIPRIVANRPSALAAKRVWKFLWVKMLVLSLTLFPLLLTLGRIESLDFRVRGYVGWAVEALSWVADRGNSGWAAASGLVLCLTMVGRGLAGFAERGMAFADALNLFYMCRKLCWFVKTPLGVLCRVV
jgi:hypothetical protein